MEDWQGHYSGVHIAYSAITLSYYGTVPLAFNHCSISLQLYISDLHVHKIWSKLVHHILKKSHKVGACTDK